MATLLSTPKILLGIFYAILILFGIWYHRDTFECQDQEPDNDYEYVETWTWPTWKGSND